MADISKIRLENQTYNIKDEVARQALTNAIHDDILSNTNNKFVMIGDSIAEGYGWWNGNSANKTTSNDGFMALLRNDYPNSHFTNLSVSGSTIANISGHSNLTPQINNVPNDTTHCFILTGINDVTLSFANNTNYIGYPNDKILDTNYISNSFNTTCNAFESSITNLLSKNNNMKIYFIIEPTIDNANYYVYDMCFAFLKFICNKYGVNVIDLRQMFRKFTEPYSSQYFRDKVHPNENGYRLMYDYVKNHIRFDLNDNFMEIPQCLITDYDIDFSNVVSSRNSAFGITNDLGKLCPLWQQNFQTIVLSTKSWGNQTYQVAYINYTTNFVVGKMEISSINFNNRIKFTTYYSFNKYDSYTTNTKLVWDNVNFSEDITNAMNITNLNQMLATGIYRIAYDKLSSITNLHSDLKNANNGYAYCQTISMDENYAIQKWYSIFKRDYIYIAYIENAQNNNMSVTWKKVATANA